MNTLSLIFAIGAGLLFLGGIFQGIVAGIELTKHAVGSGQKKKWSAIILICILLAVSSGYGAYASYNASGSTSASSSSTPSATATSAHTSNSPSPTSTAPATSAPISNNYSAIQPGSGCDTKGGGKWTSQGIDKITCGTQITINTPTRGYLYLQLPNNKAFSSNNRIGIIGTLQNYLDGSGGNCVGLEEQDANTGFLGEYCNNGKWFIYSITSGGVVIQTLDNNVTSTQTPQEISLSLKGATLSFSLGSVVLDTINVSPIHPIEGAITYRAGIGGESVSVTNFSYITPSS